jgi:hypothetical protein
MTEQEIRARALECSIRTYALLPQEARAKILASDNNKIQQNIINASLIFEEYIKEAKP